MEKNATTFEAVVRGIKSYDYGEAGLYLYRESTIRGEQSRHSRLDLGDEALKQFHIGQKVRVTVEGVE